MKNICERLLMVAGWRSTQKLSSRDLLLLTSLIFINISGASFFLSFIYDFFFIDICFVLRKLNLQWENYMKNFDRFWNIAENINRTRLNFQTALTNMVMWNLQIKIFCISGHTGNDKGRLQHPEQEIWLALTQFQRGLVRP